MRELLEQSQGPCKGGERKSNSREKLFILDVTFLTFANFYSPSSFSIKVGGSVVKNPPAKQEMWGQSLHQEGLLEKEMATHFNILAWDMPWTKEPSRVQSMGWQRVRHDLATEHTHIA